MLMAARMLKLISRMGALTAITPLIVLLLGYNVTPINGSTSTANPEGIIKLEVPASSLHSHHLILMLQKHSGKWLGLPLLWMGQNDEEDNEIDQQSFATEKETRDGRKESWNSEASSEEVRKLQHSKIIGTVSTLKESEIDQKRDKSFSVDTVYPRWVPVSEEQVLEQNNESLEIRSNKTGRSEILEQIDSNETASRETNRSTSSSLSKRKQEFLKEIEKKNGSHDEENITELSNRNRSCGPDCDEDGIIAVSPNDNVNTEMKSINATRKHDMRILNTGNGKSDIQHAVFSFKAPKICPDGKIPDRLGKCRTPFTISSHRMLSSGTNRRLAPRVGNPSRTKVIKKMIPISDGNPSQEDQDIFNEETGRKFNLEAPQLRVNGDGKTKLEFNDENRGDILTQMKKEGFKVQDDIIQSEKLIIMHQNNSNDLSNENINTKKNATSDLNNVAHLIRNSQIENFSERTHVSSESNQQKTEVTMPDTISKNNQLTPELEVGGSKLQLKNYRSNILTEKVNTERQLLTIRRKENSNNIEDLQRRSEDLFSEDDSQDHQAISRDLSEVQQSLSVDLSAVRPLTQVNPPPSAADFSRGSNQIKQPTRTHGDEDSQFFSNLTNISKQKENKTGSSIQLNDLNTSREVVDVVIELKTPEINESEKRSTNNSDPNHAANTKLPESSPNQIRDSNHEDGNGIPNAPECDGCTETNMAGDSGDSEKTKNTIEKDKSSRSSEYYPLLRYFSPNLNQFNFDRGTKNTSVFGDRPQKGQQQNLKNEGRSSIEDNDKSVIAAQTNNVTNAINLGRINGTITNNNIEISQASQTLKKLSLTNGNRDALLESQAANKEEADEKTATVLRLSNLGRTMRGIDGRNHDSYERIISSESKEIYSTPLRKLESDQYRNTVPSRQSEESILPSVVKLQPTVVKSFQVDSSAKHNYRSDRDWRQTSVPQTSESEEETTSVYKREFVPSSREISQYRQIDLSELLESDQNSFPFSVSSVNLHRNENSKERRSLELTELSSRESKEQITLKSTSNSQRYVSYNGDIRAPQEPGLHTRYQTSTLPLYYFTPKPSIANSYLSSTGPSSLSVRSRENEFDVRNRGPIFTRSNEDSSGTHFSTLKFGRNENSKFDRADSKFVSSRSRDVNSAENRLIPDSSAEQISSYSYVTYPEPSGVIGLFDSSIENTRKGRFNNPTFVSSGASLNPINLQYGAPPSTAVQNHNAFRSDKSNESEEERTNSVIPNSALRSLNILTSSSNEKSNKRHFSTNQYKFRNRPFTPIEATKSDNVEHTRIRFDDSKESFSGLGVGGVFSRGRGTTLYQVEDRDSGETFPNFGSFRREGAKTQLPLQNDDSGEKYLRSSPKTDTGFTPSLRLSDDSREGLFRRSFYYTGRGLTPHQPQNYYSRFLQPQSSSLDTSRGVTLARTLLDDSEEIFQGGSASNTGRGGSLSRLQIDGSGENSPEWISYTTSGSGLTVSLRKVDQSGEQLPFSRSYSRSRLNLSGLRTDDDGSEENFLTGRHSSGRGKTISRPQSDESGENFLTSHSNSGRGITISSFRSDDSEEPLFRSATSNLARGSNNYYRHRSLNIPDGDSDELQLRSSDRGLWANGRRRADIHDDSAEHKPSLSRHFDRPKPKSLSLWEWANQ